MNVLPRPTLAALLAEERVLCPERTAAKGDANEQGALARGRLVAGCRELRIEEEEEEEREPGVHGSHPRGHQGGLACLALAKKTAKPIEPLHSV